MLAVDGQRAIKDICPSSLQSSTVFITKAVLLNGLCSPRSRHVNIIYIHGICIVFIGTSTSIVVIQWG